MQRVIGYILTLLLLLLALDLRAGELERPFNDLQGKAQRLADYRGKWIVVNYWATWCPPCKEELPELIMFHERHKQKDAVVIGVNMEELSRKQLLAFVDDYMISYPVIPYGKSMPVLGEVPGLPTTFIINPQGEVVARQVGMVDSQSLEEFIARHGKKGVAKR